MITCLSKASTHKIPPSKSYNFLWNSSSIYSTYSKRTNLCMIHRYLALISCRPHSLLETHEEHKMIYLQKDKSLSCKQHILLMIKPYFPQDISHSSLCSLSSSQSYLDSSPYTSKLTHPHICLWIHWAQTPQHLI